jgi:copper chaperone NosL
MTRRSIFKLFAAAVVLSACAPPKGPEEPAWGKLPCSHCGMLLDDRHAAAQLVTAKNGRYFFDDVGCMVMWREEHHDMVKSAWVGGPAGSGWVDATSAKFAPAQTPMDYGFAASNGGISYDEMVSRVRAKKAGTP